MANAQERGEKSRTDETNAEVTPEVAKALGKQAAEGAEKTEDATDGIEDLLNEIDDVLEVNAEQFVKEYVQKGGE